MTTFIIILVIVLMLAVTVMVCMALTAWQKPPPWRKCPVCLRYHQDGRIRYFTPFVANPELENCHECNSKQSNLPTL